MNYKEDVAPVIVRLANLDRPAARQLLEEFGVVTGRELTEEQHAPFIAKAEAKIAEAEAKIAERLALSADFERKITLRDRLAMAALQGPVNSYHYGAPPVGGVPAEEWADRAYEIADAMLRRRTKPRKTGLQPAS